MSDPALPAPEPEGRLRRVLRQIAFGLALLGLVGVPLLAVSGGFEIHLVGVEIRAHRPVRALWVFVVGLVAFMALGGRLSLQPRRVLGSLEHHVAEWERVIGSRLPSARTVVIALAASVAVLGFVFATKSAGGADAYGYVSQADLWLSGRMAIPQPFVTAMPWPRARDTLAPLGYKAAFRDEVPSLVPTYSPGLPLIFAVFKGIGGHDALFLVVPLLGGVLVLATYGIGCRLGSPGAGLIGAVLVATSPAVLFMLMPPMTDLPVAAMWAAAFYVLTGTGGWRALAAGVLAGLAVMIRPNLVPLAAIAGFNYLPDLIRPESRRLALRHGLLFTLGVLPGIVAVGAINNNLYGSPFLSGYGRLSELFAWAHIRPNFTLYFSWLVETQSVVVLAGLAALLLPVRWLWPGLRERRRLVMAALFVYSLWAQYLAYLVFDAWWYLRFLLTAWPFMMVGVGAVALAVWRPGGRLIRTAVVGGLGLLVAFQAGVVADKPVFNQWSGERRYIAVAQMVRQATPPNSVILSMQHSGTIRYYGGRMTMRYDQLEGGWLDRAIGWLADQGVRTYLIVEPWELPVAARRFAGSRAVAKLDEPPLAIYEHPGLLFMFELSEPPVSPGPTQKFTGIDAGLRAVPPDPAPTLMLPPRTN